MATLDTHRAVTKLQDAGAPEPLAVAMVDVMEDASSRLVGRDYLRAELQKALAIQSGVMLGLMVAIAGVAITVAELI
ncbi:MAG: hypothetical protein OXH12_04660 [Chloroflexi bacterium]|nr:hypothetical protein [Chloroflexota bacterium]